jgi:high affinity choline transporter 7
MTCWNGLRALRGQHVDEAAMHRSVRWAILAIGALAMILALRAQSVQALWYFTSDLVFVLLFPQLVAALYDSKANLAGSVVAFVAALVLRLGGGEPLLGLAPFIAYPEIAARVLPIDPAAWYDASGAMLWPFRTIAAGTGMVLLPIVSRLTRRGGAASRSAR